MGEEGSSDSEFMNRKREDEDEKEQEQEQEDSDDESCKFSEYGDIEKLPDDSFLDDLGASEEYREYWKQVAITEGFNVPSHRPKDAFGGICPLDEYNPFYPYAKEGATIAVGHYNEKRAPPDGKLRVVRLETANGCAVAGMVFFLTVEAENVVSHEKNLYQTRLYRRFDGYWKVETFRKKKHAV